MGYSWIRKIQKRDNSVKYNKYIISRHFVKAGGAFVVYDITKDRTFENVR
jgi:hypothetical protein